MKKLLGIIFYLLLLSINSFGQSDSTQVNRSENASFISKQILPLSLISTGALLNIGNIKYKIQDNIPNTTNNYDNYLQYVPMVQIYAFNALGFEHESTVFDQSKYLLISQLISSSIIHLLKNITKVKRPNGGHHSFPSGHTTNAFVNATVLYHEFKNTKPFLAWSGYLFATTTGVFRMTNDAHWLPDVLVGAGVGILTTNMVYYFKPLQNFQPFKKKRLTITPIITPGTLAIHCRF